jgi:hypothetical protein
MAEILDSETLSRAQAIAEGLYPHQVEGHIWWFVRRL